MDQKCRVHCKGCMCNDPCASPELDWRISCRLTCKKRPGRDKSFLSITVVHCYFIHTHLNVVRIKQETIFLPAEVRQWWITAEVTVENSRLTIREMHFIWGVDYFGFVCKRRRRGRLNCFPLPFPLKLTLNIEIRLCFLCIPIRISDLATILSQIAHTRWTDQ